jgi:hypothetical protein
MKRPLLGTISIFVLLAGGLLLGWNYRDRIPEGARNSAGPAARSSIQASLDLILPPTAREVYCFEEDVERTKLVFARFDVSTIELAPLLAEQPQFPSVGDLTADPALLTGLIAQADPAKRAWWQPEQLRNPTCAQKSGRRNASPAVLKWRVQVCAAPMSQQMMRVYVAFSEEPVGGK